MTGLMAVPVVLAVCCCGAEGASAGGAVAVGDAFAGRDTDGLRWRVGTGALSLELELVEGRLGLASLKSALAGETVEYLDPASRRAPFGLDEGAAGTLATETVWSRRLGAGESADPAAEGLRAEVKRGDRLGFAACTGDDAGWARLQWATAVAYEGGEVMRSTDDPAAGRGPVWSYWLQATGSGCFEPLGEVVDGGAEGKLRVPEGYRAPGECPKLGATTYELLNALTLVRVWTAPRDGVVTVSGEARHPGGVPVQASVVRIAAAGPAGVEAGGWELEGEEARQVDAGGRPAAELELRLRRGDLRARLRVVAYPGTAIVRQFLELENAGAEPLALGAPAPLTLALGGEAAGTHYWMCGGTSRPNQGQLRSAAVGDEYHEAIIGEKSDNFVPWTAVLGEGGAGLFAALDYLGTWALSLDRGEDGALGLGVGLPGLAGRVLAAGEGLALPVVTLGAFRGDLDDMGQRVYDWQYEYLWDYTNSDYYARTKWAVPWFFCGRNLQEQFGARLAKLDMEADLMRTLGLEMLWDDAGWSKFPGWPDDTYANVFQPSYEGPDYAQTLHYLAKMEMPWLLWFAGRPSAGLMDGKVGAWGNFQWRTDGVGRFNAASDAAFRAQLEHFLTANPRSSFHTCDGGSRYAHQFEIQRLADVNYLSDLGRGDETNYYFSYLELPDKWLDILDPLLNGGGHFDPATSRRQLTMAAGWAMVCPEADHEALRQMVETYRYLRLEGVVGRWSYTHHPRVVGDEAMYYVQRTSHDRTRACIVLKHQAPGEVTIYPKGLRGERRYVLGFASTTRTEVLTGAELMERGITIRNQQPGELVFLGLPGRPGGGADTRAPEAPGRVLTRRETNLGHQGVGVYWSPGGDENWISWYEVRRDGEVVGKASVGTYYLDHAEGWDPGARYEVRTVDGDGNASEWTVAQRTEDEPYTAAALGGHFAQEGREGWRAETSADGVSFTPMGFVPPERNPGGDLGGTPNQPGGVEGYWEGPGAARVGRGWQKGSAEAVCVRSWTAPRAGTVRVVGRAMKDAYRQDRGGALRVRIALNGEALWPREGWAEAGLQDLVGAAHDVTVAVREGDVLRFVLDRSEAPEDALVAWMPRITYVDEGAAAAAGSVVRIRCGAQEPFVDSQGNEWSADRWFHGGTALEAAVPIQGAQPTEADQALYQAGRQGDEFSYAIPVAPGLYTVRLKFAETQLGWALERALNVAVNGREVLHDFDVCQAARGPRRAHERVVRYVVPDAEGNLVLRFSSGFVPGRVSARALVQAIEVLPETRPAVRLDCGAEGPFVDWNGAVWGADEAPAGSRVLRTEAVVSQASPTLYDQRLYQTARAGRDLRYAIKAPPGLYTVHLKFAELWLAGAGQRPLHVEVNGRRVREAWDPATAAGQLGMAADIRVEDVAPGAQGEIQVRVTAAGAEDAILQAIEVE